MFDKTSEHCINSTNAGKRACSIGLPRLTSWQKCESSRTMTAKINRPRNPTIIMTFVSENISVISHAQGNEISE